MEGINISHKIIDTDIPPEWCERLSSYLDPSPRERVIYALLKSASDAGPDTEPRDQALNTTELCETADIDRNTFYKVMDGLLELGLIREVKNPSPHPARYYQVNLEHPVVEDLSEILLTIIETPPDQSRGEWDTTLDGSDTESESESQDTSSSGESDSQSDS